MKLVTAVALAALVIVPASVAAEGLSFGMLGGLSQSQFDITSSASFITVGDPETRSRVRVGFFVEQKVHGPVCVHAGLDYIEHGWGAFEVEVGVEVGWTHVEKLPGRPPEVVEGFDPFVRYLAIPLLVKVRPDLGRVDPFAMLGPRLDIRVGQHDHPEWDECYDGFRRTQWGMTFGGGAEVALMPSVSAVFAVTYSFDFDDAYEVDLMDWWSVTVDRTSLDFVTGVRF